MRVASALMRELEDGEPTASANLRRLGRPTTAPFLLGVTGHGGVGKSSLVSALTTHWRQRDWRVCVLAIDPSSSMTGGALFGDRLRMRAHATDSHVFVRSAGTRGHWGGVSATTAELVDVMQHMQPHVLVVETVGTGQAEAAIAEIVDVTLLVSMPRTGDDVQAMKGGILEVADLIVVNKCDLPGAGQAAAELGTAQRWTAGQMRRSVLQTCAVSGDGVAELAAVLETFRPPENSPQCRFSARRAIRERVGRDVLRWLNEWLASQPEADELIASVEAGDTSLSAAVGRALAEFSGRDNSGPK